MKRSIPMEESFWSNNKQSAATEALNALVPVQGEVPNKNKNKALEDWRKLSNVYYRFYNDGDSYGRLHFMFKRYGVERPGDFRAQAEGMMRRPGADPYLEELADAVFAAACKEQNIES